MLIPNVRDVFSLVSLNGMQWLQIAFISLLPIVIIELQKKFNEMIFGKTVYEYKNLYNLY